jgi:hypothetical protein
VLEDRKPLQRTAALGLGATLLAVELDDQTVSAGAGVAGISVGEVRCLDSLTVLGDHRGGVTIFTALKDRDVGLV